MNATAIEKSTPHADELRGATRRSHLPKMSRRLRWVLVAAIAFVVVLAVLLGLVQRWLWMRQLDYAGILAGAVGWLVCSWLPRDRPFRTGRFTHQRFPTSFHRSLSAAVLAPVAPCRVSILPVWYPKQQSTRRQVLQ
jgi:hypothetical protein